VLTIVPRHWWSWDFDVVDGTRVLARIDTSAWREKGVLTIDGVEHRVYRDGVMSGAFILERDGMPLVKARKPSAFRTVLIVSYDGREYTLRKKSAWRAAFVLLEADREIGSLTPNSLWRRDARVTLTHDWPLPIRVFVIWLAIIMWKRDADAVVAAAAG
jgi:hypothetical protein